MRWVSQCDQVLADFSHKEPMLGKKKKKKAIKTFKGLGISWVENCAKHKSCVASLKTRWNVIWGFLFIEALGCSIGALTRFSRSFFLQNNKSLPNKTTGKAIMLWYISE
jgi:hypothetical protein